MKHYQDEELKGHALVFNGPLDLIREAKEACEDPTCPEFLRETPSVSFPGRRGRGWQALVDFIHTPWTEALQRVEIVQDYIRSVAMPEPKAVKRKPRWSDTDGEVDVDRAMVGEPDMFRQTFRTRVTAPMTVALVNNLDSPALVNPSGLFFRSTACIAVADLLESLGYSVEVWMWCRGGYVFPDPYSEQFVCCRMKEAGQPIDKSSMCDTMSAWFCSEAVLGALAACPVKPKDFGTPIEARESATTIEDCGIGGWAKYLEIDQGVTAVPVPMAWGSLEAAAECAVKIMQNVIRAQESGP